MTTRSTLASVANVLRSGVSPAKRAATALERTVSDPMPESDVVIASGRLKARKSVSASGLRMRKGSTTRRVSACACAVTASVSTPPAQRSSSAITSADGSRSDGRLASAWRMTRSTAAMIEDPLKAGGCS